MRRYSKIFYTLFFCILLLLTGCQKKETVQIPPLTPGDLISLEQAQALAGYTLVQDESPKSTVAGETSLFYRSEPAGAGDPVEITLVSPSEQLSKAQITNQFREMREMRPKHIRVEGLGDEAYLAFPSVHILKDGYHITITAGSGNDDVQKKLLIEFAKTALSAFDAHQNPSENLSDGSAS